MTTLVDPLSQAPDLLELPMRAALDRLDGRTRNVCGYHLGYWEADGSPTAASGKGIRPTFALLSARAAGADAQVGVPAAVACELVHNFSLLHDDVMDGDRERRHRTTAWSAYGAPSAILAGDALSALASEVLAEAESPTASRAVRAITATTRRLIAGQSADLAFESRDHVTLEECLQMADDKTGALLACAASLGAVLADAHHDLIAGLSEFGGHVGLAFQLADDLLGIWGDPRRTGKPVLSDLRSRKKTVPVVWALASETPAGERLRTFYATPPGELSDGELAQAADLIERTGARLWTEATADNELDTALTILDSLAMPDDVTAELSALAHRLNRRDH